MAYQSVFKRYELKYLLTVDQRATILDEMARYMSRDEYGASTVRNVYMDTDDFRLIRRSIERPIYKEKLRIRSYSSVTQDGEVFVELKKKYESVVYKRRLSLREEEAMRWICREASSPCKTQISREIDYFVDYYGELRPTVFLSYDREAYRSNDDGSFRVTFDDNILCRQEDVRLTSPVYGEPILGDDRVLMELKCSGGIPLWMTSLLSREKIYKTRFSKYGTAYERLILPKILREKRR